jgi:hypothetical protein
LSLHVAPTQEAAAPALDRTLPPGAPPRHHAAAVAVPVVREVTLAPELEAEVLRLTSTIPVADLVKLFRRWADRHAVPWEEESGAYLKIHERIAKGRHAEFRWHPDERV